MTAEQVEPAEEELRAVDGRVPGRRGLATRQRLLDPARVLQRGHAMLRDARNGRVVTDAARLSPGLDVAVRLRDGEALARITSVTALPKTS